MDVQLDPVVQALIGLGLLVVGLAIGVVVGRSRGAAARRRVADLERELEARGDELKHQQEAHAGYRDEVAHHFEKTSDLVHALTLQYREVYDHLAEGARALCPDRLPALGREAPSALPSGSEAGSGEDDELDPLSFEDAEHALEAAEELDPGLDSPEDRAASAAETEPAAERGEEPERREA